MRRRAGAHAPLRRENEDRGRGRKRSRDSFLAETSDPGGGGLSRGGRVRPERGTDVGVVEVVAVAEHDGRTLGGRKLAGEVFELCEGWTAVLARQLGQL